jgi:tetratricopeptide (TPR) repeat protein
MSNEVEPHAVRSEEHLAPLAVRFMSALEWRRVGQVDRAIDDLRAILRVEPRLAEPHMELASIHLAIEQPDRGLEHAREAVRLLHSGARWNEDLPENVVQSLAQNLLGEALRKVADQDAVVFGEPERWKLLMEEARQSFRRAAELDPDNHHASWAAFGFGPEPEPDEAEGTEDPDIPALDLVGLVALHEGTASSES